MHLARQLQTLEAAELIRLAAVAPELAYLFRHALVQEAAYGSLVRADRRTVHRAVGEALEGLVADWHDSPDFAAVLAQHFDRASDPRALRFAHAAAEAYLARYANAEAVMCYSVAVRWAAQPGSAGDLGALFAARGRALELDGQFDAAMANYHDMAQAGEARGDRALVLRALVLQGQLRSTVNPLFDPAEAKQLAAAGLRLALELGDQAAEAKIYWNLLNVERFTGDHHLARDYGERSLQLARALGLDEQIALTLNDLLHVYAGISAWDDHQAAADDAIRRWRAAGNLPMLADSLSSTALYSAVRGEIDAALRASAEAMEISRRINNLWGQAFSLAGVGLIHWYQGRLAEALQVTQECLRLAGEAGYIAAFVLNGADLTGILLELGQLEPALAEARTALRWGEDHIPLLIPLAQVTVADALLAAGDLEAAEGALSAVDPAVAGSVAWIADPYRRSQAALALARQSPKALALAEARLAGVGALGVRLFEAEALRAVAAAHRLAGDPAAAVAALEQACAAAAALGLRRDLWLAHAALAALAAEAGDPAAAHHRVAARSTLTPIAAELPDPLRAAFLARPDVQALMLDE
jgi:tetratricopeptide (TPR) repeat protein